MRVRTIAVLLLSVLLVTVFKNNSSPIYYGLSQELATGLPFDVENKKNNRALIFTMTDEPGRTRNIELMKSVFQEGSLGFVCESYHNKTSKEIYDKVKEVVSQMDDQGTLLLYLNSHGGGSGKNFGMSASGGSFKFSKVIQSVASVKKVKRLVVLVDTCHAEGAINEGFQGGAKLIRNIKAAMLELPDNYGGFAVPYFMEFFREGKNAFYYGQDGGAYEEALIITSSSAGDLSMRGTFALNFKKAFEKVKNKKEVTVSDFLREFAFSHSASGQQPYYKAIPDSILNEFLFKNLPAINLPVVDKSGSKNDRFKKDYILVP